MGLQENGNENSDVFFPYGNCELQNNGKGKVEQVLRMGTADHFFKKKKKKRLGEHRNRNLQELRIGKECKRNAVLFFNGT